MGGGRVIGDLYINYQGRYANVFEFPKDKMYYLLNESRAEITGPALGRNVFSGLLKLSASEDRKKFSIHNPKAWCYLTEEVKAVDKNEMSKENLMRYRKR